MNRVGLSERARRAAFASSLAPSCQHDACQNRPSRKSMDVVRVLPHRAQCVSCVADPYCISPSDRAAVLRLVAANRRSVSIELLTKPATNGCASRRLAQWHGLSDACHLIVLINTLHQQQIGFPQSVIEVIDTTKISPILSENFSVDNHSFSTP